MPGVDMANWFLREVAGRQLPDNATVAPAILMKSDIENNDMAVLQRMLDLGALCHVNEVYGEHMEDAWLERMRSELRKRGCPTVITPADDETGQGGSAYLALPLPGAELKDAAAQLQQPTVTAPADDKTGQGSSAYLAPALPAASSHDPPSPPPSLPPPPPSPPPAPPPRWPDLYDPEKLKSVAASLARDRELILFSFGHEPNEVLQRMWVYTTVAFVENLRKLGYEHLLALAFDDNECSALAAGFTESPPPQCGWSSVTLRTSGYMGGKYVRALWVQRYHTAAALAELGYNVLMMDIDAVVARDVYPLLQAMPDKYKYVFQRESPVNGGFFYLRNVTSKSPCVWLLKQVERRSSLYSKYRAQYPEEKPPGMPMDQDLLSGLFRVAAWGTSTNDMYEDYTCVLKIQTTRCGGTFRRWRRRRALNG